MLGFQKCMISVVCLKLFTIIIDSKYKKTELEKEESLREDNIMQIYCLPLYYRKYYSMFNKCYVCMQESKLCLWYNYTGYVLRFA